MDSNWCLVCEKHTLGGAYCSLSCRRIDLLKQGTTHSQSLPLETRRSSQNGMNSQHVISATPVVPVILSISNPAVGPHGFPISSASWVSGSTEKGTRESCSPVSHPTPVSSPPYPYMVSSSAPYRNTLSGKSSNTSPEACIFPKLSARLSPASAPSSSWVPAHYSTNYFGTEKADGSTPTCFEIDEMCRSSEGHLDQNELFPLPHFSLDPTVQSSSTKNSTGYSHPSWSTGGFISKSNDLPIPFVPPVLLR